MDKLKLYRESIDHIDEVIVNYLNYRFQYCQEIGKIKKESNTQVLDSNREKEIIDKLKQYEKYPGMVETIWPVIMEFSKQLQK